MEKQKYLVLDRGIITLDRVTGTEHDIARFVAGRPDGQPKLNSYLFPYLISRGHKRPFEFIDLIWFCKAPRFVRDGLFSVRTAWPDDGLLQTSGQQPETLTMEARGTPEYYSPAGGPDRDSKYLYVYWWWKQDLWALLEWLWQAQERACSWEEEQYRVVVLQEVKAHFPRVWSAWEATHGPRLTPEEVEEVTGMLHNKIVSQGLARKLGING